MAVSESLVFKPLKVGDITLSHRIACAPLTRQRADEDHVHHNVAAEYYSQRASYPGTLLITEATFISKQAGGAAHKPGIYARGQILAWRKVVEAVHLQGSFLFMQLWALGRAAKAEQLRKEDRAFEVVSSSDVPFEGGDAPRPLSVEEIRDYVDDFAIAAQAYVEEAGGDGVELHAANGYLIDQFTQTVSNKRTDEYGGSVENRCRFALEVVAAVAEAVGESKVGVRLSPFGTFQGMLMEPADIFETFSYLVTQLKARHPKLAYLHLVEPRATGNMDRTVQAGEDLNFLANIWAPRPLLTAGGHKEGDAETYARKYQNAVVVYGRYFISNPDLVARIKYGIPFAPYNRDTFYLLGPANTQGYTDYPIEYGPGGKL